MDLNVFISKFAEQFEETDIKEIQADTVFKDLDEWSSMIALSVIAMINLEYDVHVKEKDIRDSVTIEDLFNKVKK